MSTQDNKPVTVGTVTNTINRHINQIMSLVATLEDAILQRDQVIEDLNKKLSAESAVQVD